MRCSVRPRRPVRAGVRAVAVVAAVAGLLSACSTSDGKADPSPGSSASQSTTPSDTPTATDSPTPTPSTTSVPTAGHDPTPPLGLSSRLLPVADVPALRPGVGWVSAGTAPESPSSSFGTCQRFSTLSIGAERALVRRYRPASGSSAGVTAGELVAQLPDAQTARRAYAVLEAWRGRCADRLARYHTKKVDALQDVAVPGGSAGWYLLTYGWVPCGGRRCPPTRYADAQGMVVVGDRLAMVALRTIDDPASVTRAMPATLRSAARLLR